MITYRGRLAACGSWSASPNARHYILRKRVSWRFSN